MVKKKTSVYEDFDLMDDLPVSESKRGEIKPPHKSNEHYSVLDGQSRQGNPGKNQFWWMFLIFLLFLSILWLLWLLFFKDKMGNNKQVNNNQQQEQTEDGKNGEGDSDSIGGEGGGDMGGEGDGDIGAEGGDLDLVDDEFSVIDTGAQLIYDEDEDINLYTGGLIEDSLEDDTILQAELIAQRKAENSRKVLEKINEDLRIFEDGTSKFLTGLDTQNVKDKFEEYQKYKDIDIEQLSDIVKHLDIDESEKKDLEKDLEELSLLTEEFYGRDETVLPTYENKLSESLGVEKNDVQMSILIERGSQLPSSGKHTYTTRKPFQKSMFFNIYQGDEALTENNKFLGRLDITGLKPIANMGARVEVEFDLDKDGKLSIHAEDILDRSNKVSAVLDTEVDYVTKNIGDIKKVENFVKSMDIRVYRILNKVNNIHIKKKMEMNGESNLSEGENTIIPRGIPIDSN